MSYVWGGVMSVLPLRADKYAYRDDGDFLVRNVCRACEARYDVYALAPDKPFCDACLRIKKHMELIYQRKLPKPGMFRTWGSFLTGAGFLLLTFLVAWAFWWQMGQ